MGYQESFVMVRSLAEAAGIRRAFKEHAARTWVDYVVTDVPKHDMQMGNVWGFETDPEHCWTLPEGTPCLIVAGQRHPHQFCNGRWVYIDAAQGIEQGHYYDHFEALEEERIEGAWDDDPDLAQAAYEMWSEFLLYDLSGELVFPFSDMRRAVEEGVYGLEGDAEWLESIHEMRTTPWQRDLAAGIVKPDYEDGYDLPF